MLELRALHDEGLVRVPGDQVGVEARREAPLAARHARQAGRSLAEPGRQFVQAVPAEGCACPDRGQEELEGSDPSPTMSARSSSCSTSAALPTAWFTSITAPGNKALIEDLDRVTVRELVPAADLLTVEAR